ncbi:acyl-CoA dehydrogenase family member 10-like [Balaenoptera ricei]|uniref:acyl-CoA dehydrogenase family member 10-like n=1 Tax=Balaenoptera ricei TaxID=2746895 RepID=UPI0028BD5583|nr:acyl-CoA dehydrogenase family member 10-like [Balaenoptera ricei]
MVMKRHRQLLVRCGTEEQKARWLIPLLEGKACSCFAMTEPQVASSGATNIESSIREEDGFYVINGHKWWISGMLDPRCQLCVFMRKTTHTTSSSPCSWFPWILGIKIIQSLTVYGLEDAPGEVPSGLHEAPGRAGHRPGRHCPVPRGDRAGPAAGAESCPPPGRGGKEVAGQGASQRTGPEVTAAGLDIAMIKMVAPSMANRVIDHSILAFGAAGLSNNYPLAQFFTWARALHFALMRYPGRQWPRQS